MPRFFMILLLLGLTTAAQARWYLDSESSRISFVASHAGQAADVSRFLKLHGVVEEAGAATVRVELETVSTNVPQRDAELRRRVFQIAQYPEATITAALDTSHFMALADGAQQEVRLPLTLKLGGQQVVLNSELLVTRLDAFRFQVVTLAPVVLSMDDLGLAATLKPLAELGGVDRINAAVPVTAVLIFTRR